MSGRVHVRSSSHLLRRPALSSRTDARIRPRRPAMPGMLLAVGTCLFLLTSLTALAQRQPAPQRDLPPLSMTCLHHPDVLEVKPGNCPICKMALVPVRLDSAWMCPVHTQVIGEARGTCRLCRREMVPVTVSLSWSCSGEATEHLEPGRCGDGSPRVARRTLRPHGNHNPRHGGQFFMAPDNWHHLEGTYHAPRAFRLYVYDDFGRPLPPDVLRTVTARVVTEETFDPATRRTTEVRSFPLRVARSRGFLEARVDSTTLPSEMTAKVRFASSSEEYRFDFTFTELTVEPAAPVSVPPAPAPATPAPVAPASPRPPADTTPQPNVELPPDTLPDPAAILSSMPEILSQLEASRREVGSLVQRGDFGAVWVPAFRAKDLAVALEPHLGHLPADRRETAEPALAALVRGAWLLDAAGDLGNRQQVETAWTSFDAAVTAVLTAFQ